MSNQKLNQVDFEIKSELAQLFDQQLVDLKNIDIDMKDDSNTLDQDFKDPTVSSILKEMITPYERDRLIHWRKGNPFHGWNGLSMYSVFRLSPEEREAIMDEHRRLVQGLMTDEEIDLHILEALTS